jgi:hypothetical protein
MPRPIFGTLEQQRREKERRVGLLALVGLESIKRSGLDLTAPREIRLAHRLVPGNWQPLPGRGERDVRLSPELQRGIEELAAFYEIEFGAMLGYCVDAGVRQVNGTEQR